MKIREGKDAMSHLTVLQATHKIAHRRVSYTLFFDQCDILSLIF